MIGHVITLFALGLSLYLLGSRVYTGVRNYRAARMSGILKYCVKPLLAVVLLILTLIPLYNVYVYANNRKAHLQRAEYAQTYGIEPIIKSAGLSEDIVADSSLTTEKYVKLQKQRAENDGWNIVSSLSTIFFIASLTLIGFGGYVTTDGWCWAFWKNKDEPVSIREEHGQLSVYIGVMEKPYVSFPDTPENRDRFALLLFDGSSALPESVSEEV